MFLTLALDLFMAVFRVIHLDADLQCRQVGRPRRSHGWVGGRDLAVEAGSVEGRRCEGTISFLSMGVHAELCHPPGGARQV